MVTSVAMVLPLGVAVFVGSGVAAGVGPTGQPFNVALTAITSSLTVICSSPLASNAVHRVSGKLPSAMLVPVINSSIVTAPSPLQSPIQRDTFARGVSVGVGVSVAVAGKP